MSNVAVPPVPALSAEQRRQRLVDLLVVGVVRALRIQKPLSTATTEKNNNFAEGDVFRLASATEKSVTGHTG